jgi:prepilin-type N-terminal cleavage/methylation domain-containing protein
MMRQIMINCRTTQKKRGMIAPRGFTLFEFAIVIAIMAVLGGAMLSRTYNTKKNGEIDTSGQGQGYQAQAERAQVATVLGALRSALHLKVAKAIVVGKEDSVAAFANENPMTWLSEIPHNYIGEYFSPKTTDLPVESWYYDRTDKKLVYLLNHGRDFDQPTLNILKYKVRLLSDSSGSNGVVLEQVNK